MSITLCIVTIAPLVLMQLLAQWGLLFVMIVMGVSLWLGIGVSKRPSGLDQTSHQLSHIIPLRLAAVSTLISFTHHLRKLLIPLKVDSWVMSFGVTPKAFAWPARSWAALALTYVRRLSRLSVSVVRLRRS